MSVNRWVLMSTLRHTGRHDMWHILVHQSRGRSNRCKPWIDSRIRSLCRFTMISPAAGSLSKVVLPPPGVTIGRPTPTSSHPSLQSEISNRFTTQGGNALQPVKQWIANDLVYKAGQLIFSQCGSYIHWALFPKQFGFIQFLLSAKSYTG